MFDLIFENLARMPQKELVDPCSDCREFESILTQRNRRLCQSVDPVHHPTFKKDKLADHVMFQCRDCYRRAVSLKVLRRTENYRLRKHPFPRTGPLNLAFPLSYGLSSTVLLHMLHDQLDAQLAKPRGPPGYNLHVLIIEPSTICPSSPSHEEGFEAAQKCFPLFSFTRVSFHDIFDYVPDILETMSQFAGSSFVDNPSLSNQERLAAFRASISTATSRADVDYILMNRLVVAFAKRMDCRAVLWGDSDSKLAAKTLANVAKGRGSSVTWQVSDGMSPSGLEFSFPLRDLFTTELQNYATFFPELSKIIIRDEPPSETTLTKNLSIDELMMRYVQTQGEKYPGVMLNVTRTAAKLDPSQAPMTAQCSLCGSAVLESDGESGFCYGCIRSRPESS